AERTHERLLGRVGSERAIAEQVSEEPKDAAAMDRIELGERCVAGPVAHAHGHTHARRSGDVPAVAIGGARGETRKVDQRVPQNGHDPPLPPASRSYSGWAHRT